MLEIGTKVGKLLIIDTRSQFEGQLSYLCKCDCGNTRWIFASYMKRMRSCGDGCLIKKRKLEEKEAKRLHTDRTRHNDIGTRLYRIWSGIKKRCNNKASTVYRYYGGRGISYTSKWEEYVDFAKWARNNGYDDKLELDRIDNDGDYNSRNCRWTTRSENLKSRRQFAWSEDKIKPCNCDRIPHRWTCPVHNREYVKQYKIDKKERLSTNRKSFSET